jgi:serine/threonine-protein kinase
VKINVSSGPAPRIVPAVLNLSVQDALVQIGRAGLAPGKIAKTVRTDLPEGTVISVDPAVGSPIPRESPVDLEVASPKALVQVPFLAGLLATTAKTLLKSSNLGVTVIESPVAEGDPNAGRVLAQGIPPSTGVADGTTVEITVAVATAPVPAVDTTTIVTTTVP